ncbi:MAG: GNAT family N-acetyltransferase [Deltaproteobacteria bacterium]|nr:GNAT family N-acetyltransferase [Deltaproteobacteria bacterium]
MNHPASETYTLAMCTLADATALLEHSEREIRSNGENGLWFSPYDPVEDCGRATPERVQHLQSAFGISLDTPLWQRTWKLVSPALPEVIVGSLTLYGGRLNAELHRCSLGMGIEREHRDQGQGKALLAAAIAWALSQPTLAYIDLGVFDGNPRALGMYQRAGFVETGRRTDAFRVANQHVTDIHMTLTLRR